MTKTLQNTKTWENLLKAFAGESMGRMRYTYYAKTAKKEGYVQISNIFLETADNERAHAKRFFDFLGEKNIPSTIKDAVYPIGLSDKTADNLEFAIFGEHDENTVLYPNFAKIAKEEGFDRIAYLFESVAKIEKEHEERYKKLLENVKDGKVFEAGEVKIWKCRNCGHIVVGTKAPEVCPVCNHPKAFFEIKAENY